MLIALTAVLASTQWLYAGHAVGHGRLIVWFFDVGQGDAIFIETPTGVQWLIDGGPDDTVLGKLGSVMPFWDRHLDAVLLTHPHADHVTGLMHVLDRYEVDRVFTTGVEYDNHVYGEFLRQISAERGQYITEPITLTLEEGVTFTILTPLRSLRGARVEDVNDASIVGLLEYGDTSVLLTGDIGNQAELDLIPYLKPTDVLKVGHQGSRFSSANAFLSALRPRIGVISVGENDYGHPHPDTLDRLQAFGATILRTDLHGDIRLISEGGEPSLARLPL